MSQKITKIPYFGGSRSFKVIDVDIPKKLVASAWSFVLLSLERYRNVTPGQTNRQTDRQTDGQTELS